MNKNATLHLDYSNYYINGYKRNASNIRFKVDINSYKQL